jgi:hypothetical protein
MNVRAIRWLTFSQCSNTGPQDRNLNAIHDEELVPLCLEWERNPDREVSCEIIRARSRTSFCLGYGAIGLEVDVRSSELVRCYPEDGNTVPDDEGNLRSADVEETDSSRGVEYGIGWEDARRIYDAVEGRTSWCEGIIRNPHYKAVVIMEDDDFLDDEIVQQVVEHFNLPVKTVRRSSYFNLD